MDNFSLFFSFLGVCVFGGEGVHNVLMPCRLLCVDMESDHIYLYVTATLYWLDDLAPCIARKGCSKWLNSVHFHFTYIVLVCDVIV